MTLKIVFLARNDGTDMRQTKICNSLCGFGYEVTYVGWNRKPGQQKPDNLDSRIRKRIFEWPAGFGEISLNGWPQFFRYVAKVLSEIRPDVVHARDEPMATLVLPFKRIWYRHLLLDIFDSLAARRISNPVMSVAAWLIRKTAHIGSDRIVETSEQLKTWLGRYTKKATVIMNVPPDPGEKVARDYPTGKAIQLCVGGSLSRRGSQLETLLKAVELLPPGEVQIQTSGWLQDDYSVKVFIKHPTVNYRWLDTPDEFRKQAAKCDALIYLRGDAGDTEYRAWVLPNRLFDALSIARPIIVSRELKISKWIEEEKLGFVVQPGDSHGLAQVIARLREFRSQLPAFVNRVRPLFLSQYTWSAMETRLKSLYASLTKYTCK